MGAGERAVFTFCESWVTQPGHELGLLIASVARAVDAIGTPDEIGLSERSSLSGFEQLDDGPANEILWGKRSRLCYEMLGVWQEG